jgi:hypothetical protein
MEGTSMGATGKIAHIVLLALGAATMLVLAASLVVGAVDLLSRLFG